MKFYLRKYKMKFLREYGSVAQISHFCDNCMHYIQPGEMYIGRVYVSSNNKSVFVLKEHVDPCEPDPDEEEFLFSLRTPIKVNLESKVSKLESVAA